MHRRFPLRPNRFASLSRALIAPLMAAALLLGVAAVPARALDIGQYKALQKTTQHLEKHMLETTVAIISRKTGAAGSGVIVSADGLVLTAGHVLAATGDSPTIILADGTQLKSKGLGRNHHIDAGMLQIDDPKHKGPFPFSEMGHSSELKPGDWCMAVGHPGGIERGRTAPIRLGRILGSGPSGLFANQIDSDATLLPGDSGGPLFDLKGRVIGIHSNIGPIGTQNHDVPIDSFRDHWQELKSGKVIGTFNETPQHRLRFNIPNDPEQLRKMLGNEEWKRLNGLGDNADGDTAKDRAFLGAAFDAKADGAVVSRVVPDTPAADMGLHVGDKLTRFDGAAIHSVDDLRAQLDRKEPGDRVSIKIERDGKSLDFAGALQRLRAADTSDAPKHPRVLHLTPEQAKEFFDRYNKTHEHPMMRPTFGNPTYGKETPQVLKDLSPVTKSSAASLLPVICGGKQVAIGVVVDAGGLVLTKASELDANPTCKLGDRELPATIVTTNTKYDLALLKIPADHLTPVKWAGGGAPALGTWVLTPNADGKAEAVGIVGVAARPIPKYPEPLIGGNRAVIGVTLDIQDQDPVVHSVAVDGPAHKTGLQAGDRIVSIDAKPAATRADVLELLSHYKPGDTVTVGVQRGQSKMTFKIEMAAREKVHFEMPNMPDSRFGRFDQLTPSKRHSDFPDAFTHDGPISADQCGGVVLNLDGKVVGMNIARADRTATYAIPAGKLKSLVTDMLKHIGAMKS